MPIEGLQRTLLVGLGEAGAKTTDLLLAELLKLLGQPGIIQGLAVLAEGTKLEESKFYGMRHSQTSPHLTGCPIVEETRPEEVKGPLIVSPEANFETWQAEFERRVEFTLHRISQLNNLTQLTQQGFTLRRPDEIHIIVIANLAEPWVNQSLADLAEALRQTVYRTFSCHVGLSGVWLYIRPTETESLDVKPEQVFKTWPDLPATDQFDRGCFLASLTNEVGLIVGDAECLIRRTVHFLSLLIRQTTVAGLDWENNGAAGWGITLTSFGIAAVRWPGRELVEVLSTRLTEAMLKQLFTLPQSGGPTVGLARQAREATQQWLTAEKLAPPLLIDHLAVQMPRPPNCLAELVPDPPWPWLLVGTQAKLESASRRWQDDWLAACGDKIGAALAELETAWATQATTWLGRQATQNRAGSVLAVQSHMAAAGEWLNVFVEGVEHNLEEAQLDLANIEQQLGQAAESLINELATFPVSPLTTLLRWGLRPRGWLQYWARCRQVQTTARNFAHLSRGRLLVWQTISYYEEILPFYRSLLAAWQQVVEVWDHTCKQVMKAARSPALKDWPEKLERVLAASPGPWTESLTTALYHEAVEQYAGPVWEQVGDLSDWAIEGLEADEIVARLLNQIRQSLWPVAAIPVDQALCRQLPAEKAQADWLAGLAEQARPFWRYDETTLAESSRARTHRQTWLLLPNAESSPLAHLGQTWSQPPTLLSSREPEELAIVTIRRFNSGEREFGPGDSVISEQ